MSWERSIKEFKSYLKIERSLSNNTVDSYLRDVRKLQTFAQEKEISDIDITSDDIKEFIVFINKNEISARSQSRVISGIKSFYKYLILEDYIKVNPTDLIQTPRIGMKLPDTLSIHEIDNLISAIDLSHPQGQRNRAIIEVLYSCGLRVSELINLKLSNIKFKERYLKVIGKGDKERLSPIGSSALKYLKIIAPPTKNSNIGNSQRIYVFLFKPGS